MSAVALPVRNPKPEPLAQIELLVLFHPTMQSGGTNETNIPRNCAQQWLTVDVFGRIAKGELTGKPVVEDMTLMYGDGDVTELLEPLADEIANYITRE